MAGQPMARYSVRVLWSDEDEAYVATVPELDGLSAHADTAVGAVEELQTAIELAEETYRDEGWPLPEPDRVHEYSGQIRVRMPRGLHGRLASLAQDNGVSLNHLIVVLLSEGSGLLSEGLPTAGRLDAALERLEAAVAKLREGSDLPNSARERPGAA